MTRAVFLTVEYDPAVNPNVLISLALLVRGVHSRTSVSNAFNKEIIVLRYNHQNDLDNGS